MKQTSQAIAAQTFVINMGTEKPPQSQSAPSEGVAETDVKALQSDSPANPFANWPGWGGDPLSKSIIDAHHNTIATFANMRPQYDKLLTIDGLFRRAIGHLDQHPEIIAALLLHRAHASFVGAVRLVLSGQLPESYMVMRGCLENALYAAFMAGNEPRQLTWLSRGDDSESLKRVRRDFANVKVLEYLGAVAPEAHRVASELYDRTIDLGAHPNEKALWQQAKFDANGSKVNVDVDFFACGGIPHRVCLKTAAQSGVCSLDVFALVFGTRFKILGIDTELDQARAGL
ncbi:MAG: hypothetical protein JSS27_08500 [Planctomycetes bacterium]|nr:hypothetical protein [Planctomycetota bacterium]